MLICELPFSLSFCPLCWWNSSSVLQFNSLKIGTVLSFVSRVWLLSVSVCLAWDENLTGSHCLAFWYSEHVEYTNTILRGMYMHVHMYFLSYLKNYVGQPSPNLTGVSLCPFLFIELQFGTSYLYHTGIDYTSPGIILSLHLFFFLFILFFFFPESCNAWIYAGTGGRMGFLIYSKMATQ